MKSAIAQRVVIAVVGTFIWYSHAGQQRPFLTNKEILGTLNAQLASQAVDRTARFLLSEDIPLRQKIEIMQTLLDDSSYGFNHDDVVQLILAVANGYAPNTPEQEAVFKLFSDNFDKIQETRPIVTAAQHKYINVLDAIVKWAIDHIERYKQLKIDMSGLKYMALDFAIDGKREDAFKEIIARLGAITTQQATDLAWKVVTMPGKISFLSLLKQNGADLNAVRDGKTLLVQAVMNNDMPMVKALVDLNVDLSAFGDPAIGTPVQQAFSLGYKEIESFLRARGAREI